MPKKLNLLDKEVIKTILSELENGEEKDRKKHAYDNWQIYSGNQDPYVRKIIEKQRPKSHSVYTISDVSISKMITDKKAKAYKEKPVRFVNRSEDLKNQRLEDIWAEANSRRQFPYFDTVVNLHKYALMWINLIVDKETQTQKYNFMTLQPHEFSVVRDKLTGELMAVILNYASSDITSDSRSGDGLDGLLAENQADSSAQSKIYRMWSAENYVEVEVEVNKTAGGVQKSITYKPVLDNPENVNILGRLPFVFVSTELSQDYPTLNPIGQQSSRFGSMISELVTAANIQGTSVLTIEYPDVLEGKFDEIGTGISDVLELPQLSSEDGDLPPTKASYISPSPDLAGQKDSYMTYLEGVLSQHGISVGQAMSRDVEASSSGIALAIKNANVQDIIEQMQQIYVQAEKEIFEIVKAWESWKGPSVFKDEDELNIVFKKPKILISDKETLDNIKMRLDMGLMEPYQALMELDPNLSEEDAIEQHEKIKQSKMNNASKIFGAMTNNGDTETDQDDQTELE